MENKEFVNLLTHEGWKKVDPGQTRRIDYSYRFDLFVRKRRLCDLIESKVAEDSGDILNMSPNEHDENPKNSTVSDSVSNKPMGKQKGDLTPSPSLPTLSHLGEYPSIASARTVAPSLVIAFDSEWHDPHDGSGDRCMLSWQFALISGECLVEIIFIRKNKYDLTLELALGCILDLLGLPCINIDSLKTLYSSLTVDPETNELIECKYSSYSEALANSQALFNDQRKVHTLHDWSGVKSYPVTLLCHTGLVDISSFDQSGKYSIDILKHCTAVNKGLVTLQPFIVRPRSLKPENNKSGHTYLYPVSLSIDDTLCHAPAGMRSLKALGKVVGWNKIKLAPGEIENMDTLLAENPSKYFDYASNDAVVTLLYAAALYGYNNKIPVTITSAACSAMKNHMMHYFGCEKNNEFDKCYRGLETVPHGMVPMNNRDGYIESSSKEPISPDACDIQNMATRSYHGGYNASIQIGFFSFETFDYDLKNAYPTAMCLVADIDWNNPIRSELRNQDLSLQDFSIPNVGGYAPLAPMIAYVQFEFPKDVRFPCIPISDNGVLIYPRTSNGMDGVYACGPELYLALRLGATIYVKHGYFLNTLLHSETGDISYALADGVKQLVTDRSLAKKRHGSKSLEELILKTMVNSLYGKTAQNVVQKNSWSARTDEMEDLGCSAITSPVAACMTTSIVRAELLAVMNQCFEEGYHIYSVTTDGFISDMPKETLDTLDLYGIRPFIAQARLFLTDGQDSGIWETKHIQNDLLNFTTRGNVSLLSKGVCAHNSTKSGFPQDTYDDRLWLMKSVLTRTGPVEYTTDAWATFKDVAKGAAFRVTPQHKHVRMDFDLKRKPLKESFTKQYPIIEDTKYELASFDTIPYEDIAESRLYREKAKAVTVLRTMADWDRYWAKLDTHGTSLKIRDMDWAILRSCIIGHRANMWSIPALNDLCGEERNEWINSHNTSKHKFTNEDWKNAGRATRQCNMLPAEMLGKKLAELGVRN